MGFAFYEMEEVMSTPELVLKKPHLKFLTFFHWKGILVWVNPSSTLPRQYMYIKPKQGDQIGWIFAHWETIYFG
jgi:hypothetical protein